MRRFLPAVCLTLAIASSSAIGQIAIRIGPPPVVVEHPGPPPHRGWVWIQGHHRWDGHRYVWVPGHYAHPPHPGAVWVPDRYDHRGNGYVYVHGYWR